MNRHLLFALVLTTLGAAASTSGDDVFAYRTTTVEGWTVHVRESLFVDSPSETSKALEVLHAQLKLVVQALPKSVRLQLQAVPIYLSPTPAGERPKAEYHPSARWLRDHDRDPDMARGIEFTNIAIFEKEIQRMPVMALHELAHAYHHRVLGYDQQAIQAAFQAAVESKSYESVPLRANGKMRKAYAITNHKEYFAETTEAYFGINDFYPTNNAELKKHDPKMHAVLADVWKVPTQGAE